MVQNTNQDAPEEIIDLIEIVQKGKIPSGSAKKGIDFDSALSDLQETAKSTVLVSSPGLDDLLAGLEDPLLAPVDKRAEQGIDLDGALKDASLKDAFDGFVEPAQPEVPSFDSLFADLGLSDPTNATSPKETQAAPSAVDVPSASKATSPSDAASNAVSNLFSESIPGLDDVDALISKLDVPPSGGSRTIGDSQNSLDDSSLAPADLDSLLDSLLSAGGGNVQPQKIAKGQPKEISEEDLDDLLSSIEVESNGVAPAPADTAAFEPASTQAQDAGADEIPLVDLHPEGGEPDAAPSMGTSVADENADSLGEENITALFDALDTVSLEGNAQAKPSVQEDPADALLSVDNEQTLGVPSDAPAVDAPVADAAATADVVDTTADTTGTADTESMSHGSVLDMPHLDVPLVDSEQPASMSASAPLSSASPELAPQASTAEDLALESLIPDSASPDVTPEVAPDVVSDVPPSAQDVAPSVPLSATPSLADVLTGKVLNVDHDEPSDALFAGFDAVDDILDAASNATVPSSADASSVVSAPLGAPDPLAPAASADMGDMDFDPAIILAGVDELSAVAPVEPAQLVTMPVMMDTTPVTDELFERISVLEAELTLLQSRVDALENTAAGEDLQNQLMDLLVDGSPFYTRCVEIAQGIAAANVATAQAQQAEIQSQRETALEQRLLAVEERQNDLDWGRQQGISELENRFSEFENRFDLNARMEPLEERLAALEKKQRATDIEKRLAALEQSMANVPAPVEPLTPERMAAQMIELLRVDIDKAAAESAARVLREEIAALLSEQ